jgi:hypothetical protein
VPTYAEESSRRTAQALRDFEPGEAPVIIPVLMVGLGGYLVWFAVHYWRAQGELVWPSTPVKSVLQGKGIPANTQAASTTATLTAFETSYASAANQAAGSSGSGGITGPEPSGKAQNIAKLLLSKYGWSSGELGSLVTLWNGESGWNSKARNSASGAFGVAQALGHGGADTAAPDGTNEYGAEYGLSAAQAREANSGSALWQIRWGMGYIKAQYGSPSAALAAWNSRSPHWY